MRKVVSVNWLLVATFMLVLNGTCRASLVIEQVTTIGSGLGKPVRVTATADGWAATYPRDNRATIFGPTGAKLRDITPLNAPLGIAFLSPDTLFIGESNPAKVSVWRTDGTLIRSFGEGLLVKPVDIAVSTSGGTKVYVLDAGSRYVRVYDGSGNKISDIGGPSRLLRPTGISIDQASSNLLVSEMITGAIHVFALSNGAWIKDINAFGEAQGDFLRIQGNACSNLGIFTATDPFLGRIEALDMSGGFKAEAGAFGAGNAQLNLPLDAATDSSQRLAVAEFGNNRINLFRLSYNAPADALGVPDGVTVNLTGPIVTAGTQDFATSIYLEPANRSSGVRVDNVSGTISRGAVLAVSGTTSTTGGERRILASSITTTGSAAIPLPLGLSGVALGGKSLSPAVPSVEGGAGLYNVGLLVRVWGRVTSVNGSDFYVSDGSPTATWVRAPGMTIPTTGQFVAVTGICSVGTDTSGKLRPRILPRNSTDIKPI